MQILESKSTVTQMKIIWAGRLYNGLEHRPVEIMQSEEQREKRMEKNEKSQRTVGHE